MHCNHPPPKKRRPVRLSKEQKAYLKSRQYLRAREAFHRRLEVGSAAAAALKQFPRAKCAVGKIAQEIGRPDSYVRGALKLYFETWIRIFEFERCEPLNERASASVDPYVRRAVEKICKLKKRPHAKARHLLEQLRSGPQKAKDIEGAARKAGISDRTLTRVREKMRVKALRVGGRDGYWVWELPARHTAQVDGSGQTGNAIAVSPLAAAVEAGAVIVIAGVYAINNGDSPSEIHASFVLTEKADARATWLSIYPPIIPSATVVASPANNAVVYF